MLAAAILLAMRTANVVSFAPMQRSPALHKATAQDVLDFQSASAATCCKSSSSTQLSASSSSLDVTTPTPDEAAALGARDWPQQFKNADWSESVPADRSVTRYILSGRGTVSSSSSDGGGGSNSNKPRKIGPGTLIEITGPTQVDWTVAEGDEMIVLTPGYEEGGLLLGVAGALAVLCGVLVATAGG